MKVLHLIIYIVAMLSAAGVTSSCGDGLHDDEDQRLSSSVVFELSWYDPEDKGSAVSSFNVSIYTAGSSTPFLTKTMTPKEIAANPISLPKGSYSAVINDSTFFAAATFDITSDGLLIVNTTVKHILSRLSFIVEEVPVGATFRATVLNASKGWQVGVTEGGNMGITLASESSPVSIPPVTAHTDTITTEPLWLMPTVPQDDHSYILVEATDPDGTKRSCKLTCNRMQSADKYTVKLNYYDINTPLTLSPITINKWETLFVYNGEILNPTH